MRAVVPLNEGWGFCPTDACYVNSFYFDFGIRSTKGGASAPPTPCPDLSPARCVRPLNEGWGFCPTDALVSRGGQVYVQMALNEGWGFCPTDACRTSSNLARMRSAQRRVGLLPHRRVSLDASIPPTIERSTKGGASAPPTPPALPTTDPSISPLNEGWGFCPTDALLVRSAESLRLHAQRRVGLLPHRRPRNIR